MGTPLSIVYDLSFEDQLLTIIEGDESYRERASEIRQEKKGRTDYKTHTEFQGTPDDPYQVSLRVTQTDPHRPEVSPAAVTQLQQKVTVEKPAVPAEKLDFDSNLGIVLDAAEQYYETLQCEIA